DSGPGSLRAAMTNANNTPGLNSIIFAIPTTDPDFSSVTKTWQIVLTSGPLPAITDAVRIDGFTQPGSSVNTLPNGDNAFQNIIIDGSNFGSSATGLTITVDNVLVQGLVIQGFRDGISVSSPGQTGSVIQGNLIQGNTEAGIVVNDDNNTIGGTA